MKIWIFFSTCFLACTSIFATTPPVGRCYQSFFLTGDYLYWQAWSDNLEYTWKFTPEHPTDVNIESRDRKSIDHKWDQGFRVGCGYQFTCDGWGFSASYTRFRTQLSDSTEAPTPQLAALFAQTITETGLQENTGFRAEKASATWSLHFDTIDAQFGRHYWNSACLHFYPYVGLKLAFIEQTFRVNYEDVFAPDSTFAPTILIGDRFTKTKSDAWGIGPRLGFSGFWNFGCGFALLGEIAGALLWVDNDASVILIGDDPTKDPTEFTTTLKNRGISSLWPTIQLGAGIDWSCSFCYEKFLLGVQVKYENHYWWDPPNAALNLQGLTVSGRVQF